MVKEVKMFEANDGNLYKTKTGAENRNKKIVVDEVKKDLGLSKEEIGKKLEKVAVINQAIKMLLGSRSDWTTWSTHQIEWIDKELLDSIDVKTTLYVINYREYGSYGKELEKELFVEKQASFTEPELYIGDDYKLSHVEDVDSYTRKVIYEDKFSPIEIMQMKLEKGQHLTEGEISTLIYEFTEVYREEGEDSRWSRGILSVIDFNDKLYAVEWHKGLTESQENEYFSQPYEVTLERKEVTITKTVINKV